MDGAFDALAERLTNQATEEKLSAFSQRAQGVKPSKRDPSSAAQASNAPADVVSSFKGQAKIRDGVEAWRAAGIKTPVLVPLSADGKQNTAIRQVFAAF